MNTIDLAIENITSPAILAFALGMLAVAVRSDLRLPEPVYQTLTIYLLLAIGMKGGGALSESSIEEFWKPAVATLVLSIVIPILTFAVLRMAGRMSPANAAAMAAHYGSTSVVTFTAAVTFLETIGEPYEGFLPSLLAILEVPGIVVALLLARRSTTSSEGLGAALREILTGRSIVLLAGGVGIGMLAGKDGLVEVAPFFEGAFVGLLTLFLLEMGGVAARRLGDLRAAGPVVLVFALAAPPVNGTLGVLAGSAAGLSLGGAMLLGVLTASASYIAAPAAVRIALPEASPGYYLTAALAITFPFNLTVGIPLYFEIASLVNG
jgi:hypothetical protein